MCSVAKNKTTIKKLIASLNRWGWGGGKTFKETMQRFHFLPLDCKNSSVCSHTILVGLWENSLHNGRGYTSTEGKAVKIKSPYPHGANSSPSGCSPSRHVRHNVCPRAALVAMSIAPPGVSDLHWGLAWAVTVWCKGKQGKQVRMKECSMS